MNSIIIDYILRRTKTLKKLVLFGLFGLLLGWSPKPLFAHHIINGKVVSQSNNSPLSGASIVVKGTSEGTTTDEYGLTFTPGTPFYLKGSVGFQF